MEISIDRFKVACVVIAIIIGSVAGLIVGNSRKYKDIYIKIDSGSSVSIYKKSGKGDTPIYKQGSKPLFSLDSSRKVRIKQGLYVSVLRDPDNIYQKPVALMKIDPGASVVTIDQNYSSKKLTSLLPETLPQVESALFSVYPPSSTSYSVSKAALYQKGGWCGLLISSNRPDKDTVRLVYHRSNGIWSLVAGPNITLGKPSYPGVPGAVLEGVDNL